MSAPMLWLTLLLCAAATLFLASVRRIPEGHAYTLRRVGGHMRTVGAGASGKPKRRRVRRGSRPVRVAMRISSEWPNSSGRTGSQFPVPTRPAARRIAKPRANLRLFRRPGRSCNGGTAASAVPHRRV